jgi:RNA polymerase sigma-70 factor (ECF subfamily)
MNPRPDTTPSRELDDLTLARAQRGDGAAFGEMVHWYEGLVWSYLWRMLGRAASRPLVEDLFQDTFLGVHRGLARWRADGPARLSTWILAIATKVVLYRRRNLGREAPAPASLEADDGGAQMRALEQRGLVQALQRALEALPAEQRATFVLREFEGLEYEEIARVLSLEPGTVRSRLHRARESLRRALEEESP